MRKTDFCFTIFSGHLKNNVRAFPFLFILHKVQLSIRYMPDYFFSRNMGCYFLPGIMYPGTR